ncbi:MAG TPA: hypothetical protein DDW95_04980, partial [Alphaproteobacteria bacterium]|nr:hypothetical protein [Alphaproteobacteria bacterium]
AHPIGFDVTIPLKNILQGNSAVTFRVLDISLGLAHADRLFQSDDLNHTIIFKVPSLHIGANEPSQSPANCNAAPEPAGQGKTHRKAVLTALFVPRMREEPEAGGYAIFLDGPRYGALMQEYCGVDINDIHIHARDLELLRIMSEVPSLDPFLLKMHLQNNEMTINTRYLEVVAEEEAEVRGYIEQKVRPIVRRAYGETDGGSVDSRTQSFIDSIWEPQSADASQFIGAFRIPPEGIQPTLEAWKGIAYYQYQTEKTKAEIAELIKWLQSDSSVPVDIHKLIAAEAETLMMFRSRTARQLRDTYREIHAVFANYDAAYNALIKDGNPNAFRNFLQSALSQYWLIGACNTALSMAVDVWRQHNRNGRMENFDTEELRRILTTMRDALECDKNSGAVS